MKFKTNKTTNMGMVGWFNCITIKNSKNSETKTFWGLWLLAAALAFYSLNHQNAKLKDCWVTQPRMGNRSSNHLPIKLNLVIADTKKVAR